MGDVITRAYRHGTLSNEGFPLHDVPEHLATPDTTVWIDLCTPSKEQLQVLADDLGLHELAVEDALGPQRPKLDRYATHLFLSCHAVAVDVEQGALVETEVDAFVSQRWLVTIRENSAFRVEPVLERWDGSPDLAAHGVDFLLYGLLDAVVDGYLDVIQAFDDYHGLIRACCAKSGASLRSRRDPLGRVRSPLSVVTGAGSRDRRGRTRSPTGACDRT